MNTEKELETWWRMGGLNLPHKNACVEAFRLGRTHHAEAMSHGIEAMQMALVVLEDHDLAQKLRESIDRQKPINTEKELETWWQMGGLNLPHKNACVGAFHLGRIYSAEAMSHSIEAIQMALVVLKDHDLAQKLRESINRQKHGASRFF